AVGQEVAQSAVVLQQAGREGLGEVGDELGVVGALLRGVAAGGLALPVGYDCGIVLVQGLDQPGEAAGGAWRRGVDVNEVHDAGRSGGAGDLVELGGLSAQQRGCGGQVQG